MYLALLLAAILGQDLLLEPFAATALSTSVAETTRLGSIWGSCMLVALVVGGYAEARVGRERLIRAGSLGVAASLVLVTAGGIADSRGAFLAGLCCLGLSSGVATVSNLSLMLDRTATGHTGLHMGAWGMAEALGRLGGNVLGGGIRDIITVASGSPLTGYGVVFCIQALLVTGSLLILRRAQGRLIWRGP